MAKIAVRSYMDKMIYSQVKNYKDAVFIVGKGKRSKDKSVLIPVVLQLLRDEYGITAEIDDKNSGRIRVTKQTIEECIARRTSLQKQ